MVLTMRCNVMLFTLSARGPSIYCLSLLCDTHTSLPVFAVFWPMLLRFVILSEMASLGISYGVDGGREVDWQKARRQGVEGST